jgi:acid phosphatase type 7
MILRNRSHTRARVASLRHSIAVVAGLCAAAVIPVVASCGSDAQPTSGPGGSGSGGGGAGGDKPDGSAAQTFSPEGCAFTVAARPEYIDWRAATDETGATPGIRRVRLGLGGKVDHGSPGYADPATSAGFSWQTDEGTFASDVVWGKSPDPATWSARDRRSGVTWATPKGLIRANGDQRMHEAYVCGLEPETTYYYRVGGGPAGKEVWSEVHAFTTTPNDPATPVTIGVTGDSRGELNDAWRLTQRRMRERGVALQLFSGDAINLAPDQGAWEKWLDSAWKDADGSLLTLGQLLTLAAHGNHENHTPFFFGNFVQPQDPGKYPKWGELFYSVDVGPVHVIVIDDAYVVGPAADPEFTPAFEAWLRKDLEAANANRANVPWIISVHHRGEFSSSVHGDDADVQVGRAFFVPIWDEYHLDLSIAGHDHNYERSKVLTGPAERPVVKPSFAEGTVYVVCAGAGAEAYGSGTSSFTETSYEYKASGALGVYGILSVTSTQLTLDAFELRADGSDPSIDTLTITK